MPISSKRNLNFYGTDGSKDFVNGIFTIFVYEKKIKSYIRYPSKSADFAERFFETKKRFPEKLVFERSNANLIDDINSVKKTKY